MTDSNRLLLLVTAVCLGVPTALEAQTSVSGLGVRYAVPQEAFADTHESGWGVTWTSLADAGSMWVSLSTGWTRFDGKPALTAEGEAEERVDQAELLIGIGLRRGNLYVGTKAGYFFRSESEWDLVPTAHLRLGPLLVTGEAKVLGDVRWYAGALSWLTN